jgi:hypothetical protein
MICHRTIPLARRHSYDDLLAEALFLESDIAATCEASEALEHQLLAVGLKLLGMKGPELPHQSLARPDDPPSDPPSA